MRVQATVTEDTLFPAYGAQVVHMPFGEVYTSLQTGVVDMAENGINNYLVNKHYEPAPVLSLTEHEANNAALFVSDKVWSSLTDEQKKWVQAAADEVSRNEPTAAFKLEHEAQAKLEKIGVKVVKTVDKSGFMAISKPIQDKLASDLGPQRRQGPRHGTQRPIAGGLARRGAWLPAAPLRHLRIRELVMPGFNSLVLEEQRYLKWRALDWLEQVLMILCGVAITGFSVLVMCDVVTRTIGHPWLWLQEATMTFFIYGIFIGVGAATRRNDHLYLAVLAESLTGNTRLFFELFNRLVVLGVAVCMIYFGYLNFLDGFKSLRMPSMTPLSSLYAAIPLCGLLVAIFTIEQMANGWKNGFSGTLHTDEKRKAL